MHQLISQTCQWCSLTAVFSCCFDCFRTLPCVLIVFPSDGFPFQYRALSYASGTLFEPVPKQRVQHCVELAIPKEQSFALEGYFQLPRLPRGEVGESVGRSWVTCISIVSRLILFEYELLVHALCS